MAPTHWYHHNNDAHTQQEQDLVARIVILSFHGGLDPWTCDRNIIIISYYQFGDSQCGGAVWSSTNIFQTKLE